MGAELLHARCASDVDRGAGIGAEIRIGEIDISGGIEHRHVDAGTGIILPHRDDVGGLQEPLRIEQRVRRQVRRVEVDRRGHLRCVGGAGLLDHRAVVPLVVLDVIAEARHATITG